MTFQGSTSIARPSRFWDQLIQLIEEGRVVPVVGQDLLTVPESTGHKLLYPFLAARLAEYLEVNTDNLPQGTELNEVACRYLKDNRGKPQEIYAALKAVSAEAESLPVPEPLLQLADIRRIQLFVSTTFDSSLTRAINEKRFGGSPKTKVYAHSPNEVQDIPGDLASLDIPVVYQLMGKLSAIPAYAVTQEDLLEFFHSLQSDTHRPKQLFHELTNRSLLMLGTRLSGWLTSFLMRMAKSQRLLSDSKTDYVADDTVRNDQNLVLFLERFSSATKIYSESDAVAFVNELHKRWTDKHPPNVPQSEPYSLTPELELGAVFLSYASEDRSVVENIKEALDKGGVDVFFDRDQLRGGDRWLPKLERNIHECSLFVPIISRNTLTLERRYFKFEWNQALVEARQALSEEIFLFPVLTDETKLPTEFKDCQSTALPGGNPTVEFVQRVRQLQRKYREARLGEV
jgi:hypothetical protein